MGDRDHHALLQSKQLVENSLNILTRCLADPDAATIEDGLLCKQKKILLGSKDPLAGAIMDLASLAIKLDQHMQENDKDSVNSSASLADADAQIIRQFISRQERQF